MTRQKTERIERGATYPGENVWKTNTRYRWTGEYRNPKAGEYYLSGAIISAYRAMADLLSPFHIAKPVEMETCSHCKGSGRMAKLLVAVLLLTASTASADMFDALAIAGAASDVVTTEVALRRGFVESNLGNRYVRVGANVALTGAMLLAAREADKAGHKNMAKVVKVATFLTWGFIGYHNVRTMQRGVTP